MVPSIGKAPFDRAGWIFELTYDGCRAIVGKHKGTMKMLSRQGNDFLPSFPEIAKCLETLRDLVLDGELVVLDEQGRAQFEPLRRRARSCASRRTSSRLRARRRLQSSPSPSSRCAARICGATR